MHRLGTLVLAMALASSAAAQLKLGIHSDEPSPAVAQLFFERFPRSLQVEIVNFSDTQKIKQALQSGDLDLAFVEDPSEPIDSVSTIGTLYPSVLHTVVKKELTNMDRHRLKWRCSRSSVNRFSHSALALVEAVNIHPSRTVRAPR